MPSSIVVALLFVVTLVRLFVTLNVLTGGLVELEAVVALVAEVAVVALVLVAVVDDVVGGITISFA